MNSYEGEQWFVGESVLGENDRSASARRNQHQRDDRCRVQAIVTHVQCSWLAEQARCDW
jgi:hypothetical protein